MSARPIVVVTGGRDYADAAHVARELTELAPGLVVQGGATGADKRAREWCESTGVDYLTMPALWTARGRGAGPRRNAAMIEIARRLGGRLCVAFPGGSGTADCVERATRAGMEVRHARPDTLAATVNAHPVVQRAIAAFGGRVDVVEGADRVVADDVSDTPDE